MAKLYLTTKMNDEATDFIGIEKQAKRTTRSCISKCSLSVIKVNICVRRAHVVHLKIFIHVRA